MKVLWGLLGLLSLIAGCADLNRQRCACTPPQLHAALAALRNFKVNKA